MLKKLTKLETILSLAAILGFGSIVTYFAAQIKSNFPIMADMRWEGWALFFIVSTIAFALPASLVMLLLANTYRKIRPLPKNPKVGIRIHSCAAGMVTNTTEKLHNDHKTLVTLGAKVWCSYGKCHIVDWRLFIKDGINLYGGFQRKSDGKVMVDGNVFFETKNSLDEKTDTRPLTDVPFNGTITFISNAPETVFQKPSTIIILEVENTLGDKFEEEILIGRI